MKVEILGNQAPFCLNGQKGVGYLVKSGGDNIMLDAGSGTHASLNVKDYENLNLIISHGHYDHVADIENVLYGALTLKNNEIIKPKLSIWLPAEYRDPLEKKTLVAHLKTTDVARIERYGANDTIEFEGGAVVNFRKTTHSPDSYATKITEPACATKKADMGRKIILGYTGDIGTNDIRGLAGFYRDATAIIAECSVPQHKDNPYKHMQPRDCAFLKEITRAKDMYLTHFFPTEPAGNYLADCQKYADNVHIAHEGLEFEMR